MKIYDISQEVFSCVVYPGDPAPQREVLSNMNEGALYNLTSLHMCAHNGTHVDAPYHFIKDGKTIEQISLEQFVGLCFVAKHEGVVTAENAREILQKAAGRSEMLSAVNGEPTDGKKVIKECDVDASKRILIKGQAEVSADAARVFAEAGVLLVGNESQTVGPEHAPMEVHKILLGAGVVLLEGIRLAEVSEGVYL